MDDLPSEPVSYLVFTIPARTLANAPHIEELLGKTLKVRVPSFRDPAASSSWFEIDKDGLNKATGQRDKTFIVNELVQNALDANPSRIDVTLTKQPGSRYANLRVEDDSPDGFHDLTHAWTLFAESTRKAVADQRGRFNFGEKRVIAACESVTIVSTKGGVCFDASGRRRLRRVRAKGTVFEARLLLTNAELELCSRAMRKLIVPEAVELSFNGDVLQSRAPLTEFEATLRTEIADEDGNLRPTTRKTLVRVYKVRGGETGSVYELGIPVVETGDAYDVDVQQKIPLGLDRDNVSPAFLRTLRTLVLNVTHDVMAPAQSTSRWVKDALGAKGISEDAVRSVIKHRFGAKSVVFDPSDLEANAIAVTKGYTVVHGGQLSKEEWQNVRQAGALMPAGKVTLSPRPYSEDGSPVEVVPPSEWTADETAVVKLFKRLAPGLIGRELRVSIVVAPHNPFVACYGRSTGMDLNRPKLGRGFFASGCSERVLFILIHELAHEFASNHLSEEYYDALTSLGARLALMIARDASLLVMTGRQEVSP